MADLIKKIKIKKQDGTFTDYIPIGAEASNVSTEDGLSVENKLKKKPYYFDTVADMKAANYLVTGDCTITLGYDNVNDGGGTKYIITDDESEVNYQEELDNGLYAIKINKDYITPDDFTGTDSEKLQSALDSIYLTGGTIVINREYQLTADLLIKQNSNTNVITTLIGLGQKSIINMGAYSIKGHDESERTYGAITFDNINLVGIGNLLKTKNLIRIKFINCVISGFEHVIYENVSENAALQTVYFISSTIRNTTDVAIKLTGSTYDLKVSNCLIEWCHGFIDINGNTYQTVIINNCIEGISQEYMIKLQKIILGFNFSYNYIEGNLSGYIDLTGISNSYGTKINIDHNQFFGRNNEGKFIELPTQASIGNISINNNGCSDTNDYLVDAPSNANSLKAVNLYSNNKNINDPNNKLMPPFEKTLDNLPRVFYARGLAGATITANFPSSYASGIIIASNTAIGAGTGVIYRASSSSIGITDLGGMSLNDNYTITYANSQITITPTSSSGVNRVSILWVDMQDKY